MWQRLRTQREALDFAAEPRDVSIVAFVRDTPPGGPDTGRALEAFDAVAAEWLLAPGVDFAVATGEGVGRM